MVSRVVLDDGDSYLETFILYFILRLGLGLAYVISRRITRGTMGRGKRSLAVRQISEIVS